MRLATLAFIVALGLAAAIGGASLMGYDAQSIGMLIEGTEHPATTSLDRAPERQPADARIAVPSGTFHGPTGQPTVHGPSGPPPQE